MSRDLEEQLEEMGPEYRAVVARLKGNREQESGIRGWLVAASLLVVVGLGVVFLGREDFRRETGDVSYAPREYRASVSEMIATQNPDGSWTNDFLTRRNAAALRGSSNPAALIAYKKALRYLHAKGLKPMNGSCRKTGPSFS